jgi:hypothetical protein
VLSSTISTCLLAGGLLSYSVCVPLVQRGEAGEAGEAGKASSVVNVRTRRLIRCSQNATQLRIGPHSSH